MRQINQRGLALIKKNEVLMLCAGREADGQLTIGYGHTGRDVFPGKEITEDEADRLLISDLQWLIERVLARIHIEVNDNELSALISLVRAVGIRQFSSSTLLKFLNKGEKARAADAFMWLDESNPSDTGAARRAARTLFLSPPDV